MKFGNPAILYALFLLLIPLLVHLFRFRRFKKIIFPNVAFLTQVEKESRRSRRLKKYLVLLTRMLVLLFLILGFARPYIPAKEDNEAKRNLIVFDASLSTSYQNQSQSVFMDLYAILQQSLKDELHYLFYDGGVFSAYDAGQIAGIIRKKGFDPLVFDHAQVVGKISRMEDFRKKVYYFTDAQFLNNTSLSLMRRDTMTAYFLMIRKPVFPVNAWIDTLYITDNKLDGFTLEAVIKGKGSSFDLVLDLYAEQNLLFKRKFSLPKNESDTIRFEVPKKYKVRYGKLKLSGENHLLFDNELFFKIPQPLTYNILFAGDRMPGFFKSLYEHPNIKLHFFTPGEVPWNSLDEFDLLILYGWKTFYNFDLLERYLRKGKLIFIPGAGQNDLHFYRQFGFATPRFDTVRREIIRINYDSRFFNDVFTKTESKFNPPSVHSTYLLDDKYETLLYMEGGRPFLQRKNNALIFSADIDASNSDFYLSPLVVPVFYKPLWMHTRRNLLYHYIRPAGHFIVKAKPSEKPVEIRSGSEGFIPYQERIGKELRLFVRDEISRAGIYYVIAGRDTLEVLALNYDRRESRPEYLSEQVNLPGNVRLITSKPDDEVLGTGQPRHLSRWFFVSALFFFLLEMILLRWWKWN